MKLDKLGMLSEDLKNNDELEIDRELLIDFLESLYHQIVDIRYELYYKL